MQPLKKPCDCGCADCAKPATALAAAAVRPAPAVVLLKPADLRACRFCNRGARRFFLAHNLDWQLFIQQGIDVRLLEATGDPMAMRAVKAARLRVATKPQAVNAARKRVAEHG